MICVWRVIGGTWAVKNGRAYPQVNKALGCQRTWRNKREIVARLGRKRARLNARPTPDATRLQLALSFSLQTVTHSQATTERMRDTRYVNISVVWYYFLCCF